VKRRSQRVKVEEPVDKAARLKREERLERLRQYYQAHKDKLCKKQKEAYKAYYCQNKDRVLPELKKRYVERVSKGKGLEICPCCGKLKGPPAKRDK